MLSLKLNVISPLAKRNSPLSEVPRLRLKSRCAVILCDPDILFNLCEVKMFLPIIVSTILHDNFGFHMTAAKSGDFAERSNFEFQITCGDVRRLRRAVL